MIGAEDKKIEELSALNDEWGGIDKEILDTVVSLNKLGIITDGSCYGHLDKSSPAPWIGVGASPDATKEDTEIAKEKIYLLLNEFYANRIVSESTKLIVDDFGGSDHFWIHNGGEEWKEWRIDVDDIVERIKRGEKPTGYFNDARKAKRAKTLPIYQKEMDEFAVFLKTKVV